MEENKLSTNLEQINASVSDIRSTLGAEGVSIDELSTKVGEVKTNLDELENNMVYQVNTREEMYALNNVSEGSTCLAKGQEIRPSRVEDKFTMIYFPETVTLPIGFPDESFSLYIADTGHGSISGTLSGPYFDFTMIIKGQGSYGKNIKYVATTEGNQYVYHRQDTFGSPVQSAGELSYQTFGPCASEFFRILDEFEETYIYREGGWAQYSLDEINELNTIIEEQDNMIATQEQEIEEKNVQINNANAEIEALNTRVEELENNQSGENASGVYFVDSLDALNALLGVNN